MAHQSVDRKGTSVTPAVSKQSAKHPPVGVATGIATVVIFRQLIVSFCYNGLVSGAESTVHPR